jgi:FkbM family methyltransferase
MTMHAGSPSAPPAERFASSVCIGPRCVSLAAAFHKCGRGLPDRSCFAALPPLVDASASRNGSCILNPRGSLKRSPPTCDTDAPLFAFNATFAAEETWNLSLATRNLSRLKLDALNWKQPHKNASFENVSKRMRNDVIDSAGWVPPRMDGWAPPVYDAATRTAHKCQARMRKRGFCASPLTSGELPDGRWGVLSGAWRRISREATWSKAGTLLPCSDARGEDAIVLRSFFTDRMTGEPVRRTAGGEPPHFLEIGAQDGYMESNTWALERCLGWRGVLVEALPQNFELLLRVRPASLNLRLAACQTHRWVDFSKGRHGSRHPSAQEAVSAEATGLQVQCGPLNDYLALLNIRRLDFVSVDVEGGEVAVLDSFDSDALSIGVLLVEVRGDGARPQVMARLLARGFLFVGTFYARGSMANAVVDDCFVNVTHMRVHFPDSRGANAGAEGDAAADAAFARQAAPAAPALGLEAAAVAARSNFGLV